MYMYNTVYFITLFVIVDPTVLSFLSMNFFINEKNVDNQDYLPFHPIQYNILYHKIKCGLMFDSDEDYNY